jgi:hypothetical protein
MAESQWLAGVMRKYLMTAAGLLAAMIVIGPVAFGAFGAIGVGAVLFGAYLSRCSTNSGGTGCGPSIPILIFAWRGRGIPDGGYRDIGRLANCNPSGARIGCTGSASALQGEARFRARF